MINQQADIYTYILLIRESSKSEELDGLFSLFNFSAATNPDRRAVHLHEESIFREAIFYCNCLIKFTICITFSLKEGQYCIFCNAVYSAIALFISATGITALF